MFVMFSGKDVNIIDELLSNIHKESIDYNKVA